MQVVKTTPRIQQFTGTKKRKAYLSTTTGTGPLSTASFWDSGSRSYFTVRNMVTGEEKQPPTGHYPTFHAEYSLQPNEVLIEREISQGQDTPPSFTCLTHEKSVMMEWLGQPEIIREF